MDARTAVSGSSPAYVFMKIEAMADPTVIGRIAEKSGIYIRPQKQDLGSAKMGT